MQKLSWEAIPNIGKPIFGVSYRLRTPSGWLVSNQPGQSTVSDKCLVEIPDASHSWAPAEFAWETVVSFDGKGPATYRAKIVGGFLVGSIVGATNSSRTLAFVADDGTWLADQIPVPDPIPVPSTKWIGTNLLGVHDWSAYWPFANFFATSRSWISGVVGTWDDGRVLNLGSRGNLLSLQPGQIARSVLFSAGRPVEDFEFSWKGKGSFGFDGMTVVSQTAGNWTVRPSSSGNVVLNITAIDPADPIRDILFKPKRHTGSVGLFNPDFVADMRNYGCIRWMDIQATNFNRSQASLARDFTSVSSLPIRLTNDGQESVPLEVLIAACNTIGVDGWFCVHISADSAYIDRFLQTIKTQLNPGLKAYVELGNEAFNSAGGFFTHQALPGTLEEKMAAYALRAADLGVKTKAVLGSRGVSILGAQNGATFWQEHAITTIKAAGKPLPEVLTIAPYFGAGLPDSSSVFTDGSLVASMDRNLQRMRDTKALAAKYGMRANAYECGQHVVPGAVVSADPRMEQIYLNYLAGLKAAIPGELVCHYLWVSDHNQYGAWGERTMQYGPPTPKSRAIAAAM